MRRRIPSRSRSSPGAVPEPARPKGPSRGQAGRGRAFPPVLTAKPGRRGPRSRTASPEGAPALRLARWSIGATGAGRIYVEAQLLVWADTFAKRSRAPYAFKGRRGELLDEAVRVRRIAEEAAASDERIARWVVPIVEAGDDLRRRAQDGLFAANTGLGTVEALRRLLEDARTLDRQALEAADRCTRALGLVEQVEAELPYYGEWKARQAGHREEGLDADMIALLAASTRLSRMLQADARELASHRASSEARDDAPQAVLERIQRGRGSVSRGEGPLGSPDDRVPGAVVQPRRGGGAGRWREVDRVLCVPMIPAEVRRSLLRRVRSVAVASSLSGNEEVPPATATSGSEPGDFQGYARQQTEKAIAGASRGMRDDDRANADSAGPAAADPDFWNLALALARLDWGLLELGGASDADLSRIESAFPAARSAARGDPATAFEAFERLSRVLRAARADRSQAVRQTRGTSYVPLAMADRAARVLPLSEILSDSDKATETLDRFQRQALLLWHGRRLLRDFAPEHAMRLFEEARQYFDTEDLRAAAEEAGAMSSARIVATLKSEDNLVIDEWAERRSTSRSRPAAPCPRATPSS